MKNKLSFIFLFLIFSIFVLWFLCPFVADKYSAKSGLLPSIEPTEDPPKTTQEPILEPTPTKELPYSYYTITEDEPDFKLSMHVLEVKPSNPEIEIMPVTSHNTLFGYAYLSEMDGKWNAIASVNGGFSHSNGLLGGLYAKEGELIIPATGQYPVLVMSNGKANIYDATSDVWIASQGLRLGSIYYNQFPKGDGLYVFSPTYGTENRIDKNHLNAVISKGEVRGLIERKESTEIPRDGFLVSALGDYSKKRLKQALKAGMMVEIKHEIRANGEIINDYDWAYECGSWIIKDGNIAVPESDTWVGTLKTRTPRTAVGIKQDGTLVFIVADGRQKELSHGLTGEELAKRLINIGVRDAAFLDGGASSEMIINGKIVNSPSAGRERMLASGFVIMKK